MRTPTLVIILLASASIFWGCSSKSTSTAGPDGGVEDSGGVALNDSGVDDAADASAADTGTAGDGGGGGGEVNLSGCGVKRAASADACAEPCGARLKLPGGGSFCTVECANNTECSAPGSDLICPSTIGACVPRCTGDASCKAAGFLRCDTTVGACDTI